MSPVRRRIGNVLFCALGLLTFTAVVLAVLDGDPTFEAGIDPPPVTTVPADVPATGSTTTSTVSSTVTTVPLTRGGPAPPAVIQTPVPETPAAPSSVGPAGPQGPQGPPGPSPVSPPTDSTFDVCVLADLICAQAG